MRKGRAMICYRDMTFCDYHKDCKDGKDCHAALTEKVYQEAKQWFGKDGAPICRFTEHPDCFEAKR